MMPKHAIAAMLVASVMQIVMGGAQPSLAAPPAPPASQPAVRDGVFDWMGIHFTPPNGWQRVPEGSATTVARYVRIPTKARPNRAVMMIELEGVNHRDLTDYAGSIAKGSHGSAAGAARDVGGERAIQISGGTMGGGKCETLVTRHGAFFYVISGVAEKGEEPPIKAMGQVARSVKFVPLVHASTITARRGERFPLFDNKVTFEPLATMRPDEIDAPATEAIQLSVYDFAGGASDLTMSLTLIPNPEQGTLAQVETALGKRFGRDGQPPKWTSINTRGHNAVLSETFTANLGAATGGADIRCRVGLYTLDPHTVLQVMFIFPNHDPKVVKVYEGITPQLMQAIAPAD